MRMFLALLIFAIGFSGYATATHAMEMGSKEVSMDCHKAQSDDTQNEKSDVQCHDCCLANAVFTSLTHLPTLNIPSDVKPLKTDAFIDSFVFSLLRPPRTLA